MKRRTHRKQRGGAGYAPLQYVNPHYHMPAAWSAGENKALPVPDLIARPALAANFAGGARAVRGLPQGGRFRGPSRKRSSHRKRRSTKRRTHRGGFMPSIMSPVVANFGVVAPAVALAGYRYMDQAKGLSKKAMGLLPGRRSRKH